MGGCPHRYYKYLPGYAGKLTLVSAARTGFGLNGARDSTGRVMPPEEQYVTHMARKRPDYEGMNFLVQFGLGFTPGWVLRIESPPRTRRRHRQMRVYGL